ncbi:CD36 family protein [Pelomyxa schiedti]|nr:CD36 family protein [Pelomyxa schiedti]
MKYGITSPLALRYLLAIVCAGGVLFIVGFLGGLGLQEFGHRMVKNTLVISSNESTGYDNWVSEEYKNDEGLLMEMYFWNMTNPQAVLAGGVPHYNETGPYLWRTYDRALNPEWNDNRTEVTYVQRLYNKYVGTENISNIKITLMNPFYMATIITAGGEQALLIRFTAPALTQIVANLRGAQFQLQSSAGATANMLPLERQGFTSKMGATAFMAMWANATSDYPGVHPGMRVSTAGYPSNITYPQALQLWNCTLAYSFCNKVMNQGVFLWVAAARNVTASAMALKALTGLSTVQVSLVAQWVENYRVTIALPTIMTKFNLTDPADIGNVQWGTGQILGGNSVADSTTLPGIPELAVFAKRALNVTVALTNTQEYNLLLGPSRITLAPNLGAFLTLAKSGDVTTIQTRWGIPPQVVAPLSQYINQVTVKWVMPTLQACFAKGGGLISTRTVEQWMNATDNGQPWPDPLLALLGVTPNSRQLIVNDFNNEMAITRNQTFTKRTGFKNITEVFWVDQRCSSSYWSWAEPVRIEGYDGTRVPPFNSKASLPQSYLFWNEDMKRPYTVKFHNWSMVQGLNCSTYQPIGEAKLINPLYWNYYSGISNVSALNKGAPLFSSFPHLTAGGEYWMNNFTSNMCPDPDQYTTTFWIDPYSGMTVKASTLTQVNLILTPQQGPLFQPINTLVRRNALYPLFWSRKSATAAEDKTDKLAMLANADDAGSVFIVVVTIIGALVLAAGSTLLIVWGISQYNESLMPDEMFDA